MWTCNHFERSLDIVIYITLYKALGDALGAHAKHVLSLSMRRTLERLRVNRFNVAQIRPACHEPNACETIHWPL